MPALRESLTLYAEACKVAECDAWLHLYAFDGADMNVGMSIICEMTRQGIHLWLFEFGEVHENKESSPDRTKLSAPGGSNSGF